MTTHVFYHSSRQVWETGGGCGGAGTGPQKLSTMNFFLRIFNALLRIPTLVTTLSRTGLIKAVCSLGWKVLKWLW